VIYNFSQSETRIANDAMIFFLSDED